MLQRIGPQFPTPWSPCRSPRMTWSMKYWVRILYAPNKTTTVSKCHLGKCQVCFDVLACTPGTNKVHLRSHWCWSQPFLCWQVINKHLCDLPLCYCLCVMSDFAFLNWTWRLFDWKYCPCSFGCLKCFSYILSSSIYQMKLRIMILLELIWQLWAPQFTL